MSTVHIVLWLLLAVSVATYWWVGKVYISQPRFNHPALFWRSSIAKALVLGPQIVLAVVVIGGFFFTKSGWWFLGVAVAAVVLFAPRTATF